MRKYYLYICSLCFFLMGQITSFAQFPYQSTLTSGNDFNQFSGNGVKFDSNGATLTDRSSSTYGFYLNDLAFTVERGFIIEFDYIMTGGGSGGWIGDGLALVLFDGNVTSPTMGSDGSGLTYAYKKTTSGSGSDGLSSGFLAVGVDLWGSFKYRRSETTEYRNGIIDGQNTLTDGKANDVKNHITIRGQGSGKVGYPVLITQSTIDFKSRTQLNFTNGKYDILPKDPQTSSFSFGVRETTTNSSSDIGATFGHNSYRRVIVSMLPGKKADIEGFYIAVDMIHGKDKDRIINDFFLPREGTIKYMEANGVNSNVLTDLVLKTPRTFKIGFGGSTGGAYQTQIVRNLSLYMPFSPSIKDLFLTDICKDTPTEISILANSVGFNNNKYSGEGDIHNLGKSEYLDPYSFQFRTLINGIYEDTAQPYVAVTKYGTYEYNPKTMKAIFTPTKGVTMPEFDQVYFTIKNKEKVLGGELNIGSEQFRSNTGTVRLTFGKNCNDVLMVNGNAI